MNVGVKSTLGMVKQTVECNVVKRSLEQGRLSVGTMAFEFNTSGISHLAAHAGPSS
jgi:hypothetical protein